MNCESRDRFDHYLGQAVAHGCSGVADYYDSIDTAGVSISRRLDRMVYRLIRKGERAKVRPQTWSTPRRVISGIVIALAILMALTMSIAALNSNLWNAVVDWYEDHFSLHLGQTSSPPATLPPTKTPTEPAPRLLKEAKKPAALPKGWTDEVVDICQYWVDVDFFEDGDMIGYYTQAVMSVKHFFDAPQKVEEHRQVKVGGYSGDFYSCTNGYHVLRWCDMQYFYSITVYYNSLSMEQMIDMAENLGIIDGPPPSIIEVRRPTGMLREVREIVLESSSEYTRIRYLDAEGGYILAQFAQGILHNNQYEFSFIDMDYVYEVMIGDGLGLAYSYYGDCIDFLYWTDGDYLYCLSNECLSDAELIEWAESVKSSGIPDQLMTVYRPQNLPNDLEEVVWIKNSERMVADYSRGDQIIFAYTQELLSQPQTADRREYQGRVVEIHHDHGYARLFADGSITLTWNNGQYRFVLESEVMTLDELVAVARDIAPPEEIVEVRGPDGLSAEITQTVVAQNDSMVITEYTHGEQMIGRFVQTLRWNDSAEYDPGCEMQDVTIGTSLGVLLTYPDGRRTVIWNDGSYRYQLESGCMTTDVILAWAGSVKALESEEQEPVDIRLPTVVEEVRKPKKLASGMSEIMTIKTEDCVTVYYQKKGEEVAVFTQCIISEDTALDGDIYLNAKSVEINQYAILVLTTDQDERILLWTDGQYYYRLQSSTLSAKDMLICAQSMIE